MSHDTTFGATYAGQRPAATPGRDTAAGSWLRRLAARFGRGVSEVNAVLEEAAAVRAMAQRLQNSQPGFAADLLAAADRHARQFDARR